MVALLLPEVACSGRPAMLRVEAISNPEAIQHHGPVRRTSAIFCSQQNVFHRQKIRFVPESGVGETAELDRELELDVLHHAEIARRKDERARRDRENRARSAAMKLQEDKRDLKKWVFRKRIAHLRWEEDESRSDIESAADHFAAASRERVRLLRLVSKEEAQCKRLQLVTKREAQSLFKLGLLGESPNVATTSTFRADLLPFRSRSIEWYVYRPPHEWISKALLDRSSTQLQASYFKKLVLYRQKQQKRRCAIKEATYLFSKNKAVVFSHRFANWRLFVQLERQRRAEHAVAIGDQMRRFENQRLGLEDREIDEREKVEAFEGQLRMGLEFDRSKDKNAAEGRIRQAEKDQKERLNRSVRRARQLAQQAERSMLQRCFDYLAAKRTCTLLRREHLAVSARRAGRLEDKFVIRVARVYYDRLRGFVGKMRKRRWNTYLAESLGEKVSMVARGLAFSRLAEYARRSREKRVCRQRRANGLWAANAAKLQVVYFGTLREFVASNRRTKAVHSIRGGADVVLRLSRWKTWKQFCTVRSKRSRTARISNELSSRTANGLMLRYFEVWSAFVYRRRDRDSRARLCLASNIQAHMALAYCRWYLHHKRRTTECLARQKQEQTSARDVRVQKLASKHSLILTRRYWRSLRRLVKKGGGVQHTDQYKAHFLERRSRRALLESAYRVWSASLSVQVSA
ncbi:hypothetical protein DIPPA_60529 [Diplonema papillatum]|nr:hypothetical protein DIPPA_60529 [Diplonema papillatum]